jgi:cob(I)alamin adenosyltransferase
VECDADELSEGNASGRPRVAVGSYAGFGYIRAMKIYTRTGDRGDTSLFGGQRVSKDALRIEAYGTVDELNSVLGIVRADNAQPDLDRLLARIQDALFVLGADLATPRSADKKDLRRITAADAEILEGEIDAIEARLQPLRSFILPGGSPVAARLHFARTVCRRAERNVVRLSRTEDIGDDVTVYLNRLSDLLFVLARFANHIANVPETPWRP